MGLRPYSKTVSLTPSNYSVLQKGASAPVFSLRGTDDKTHSLSEFKNAKVVLVVFMCNHCPYVKPKVEKLVKLQQTYSQKGLAIVGINSNDTGQYPEDSFENMKKFVQQKKINFVYLIDETQSVAKAYGAACTPDPFLFNQNHELVYHGRIDDAHGQPHAKASTNELEEAIIQLLNTGKVTVAPEPSYGCNVKWKE